MSNRRALLLPSVAVLSLLGAAAWTLRGSPGETSRSQSPTPTLAETRHSTVALRVGDRTFSSSDIEASRRVLALRYPESPSVDVGAWARLIEASLQEVALGRMGKALTTENITSEERRIDGSTRAPEDLARIKTACGGGETYRSVYVLPTLASRRFHFEVYPWHSPAHAAQKKAAEAVLERAKTSSLAAAARGTEARVEAGALTKDGFTVERTDNEPARETWRLNDPERLVERAAKLPPGGLLETLLEEQTSFVVLKRRPAAAAATALVPVEIAVLAKAPADEWLWHEVGDVVIDVADARMAERLRNEVAWTRRTALAATR